MKFMTPYWPTRNLTAPEITADIARMFEEFGRVPSFENFGKTFVPACEISETKDHFHMSVDLPGIKKEDIKIELKDNALTISGERKQEKKGDGDKNAHYVERFYGGFTRIFKIPETADGEKIQARYENGVLEIDIPKTTEATARKIEIQS